MNEVIRPIVYEDIRILNKWKNDKSVYEFLGGGFLPVSINTQEKWLDSLIDTTGNNKRFIIINDESMPIGLTGLYNINWIHRTCEVGLFIGEISSHGQGYGSKAYKTIEKFARETLNLRKLKLNVVETNNNAVLFWDKLGYKHVGTLNEERFINNKYHNLLILEKFIGD